MNANSDTLPIARTKPQPGAKSAAQPEPQPGAKPAGRTKSQPPESPRFLVDFDEENIIKEYHDVIIIGSGIAGMYTALEIPEKYKVTVLTKESIDISSSVLAQGGIAVSLGKKDSPDLHLKDTLYAGAGLCDEEAVRVLVTEAVENIQQLRRFGVNFDMEKNHELSLGREAAHSMNRIIHARDSTGKEVLEKLIEEVKMRPNIDIHERNFVIDLLIKDGRCCGMLVWNEDSQSLVLYFSKVIVCATGGFGRIYSNTTNPEVATGDGICMAYRAGAELTDLEFIQFHPTVLYHPNNKSFLISEAVRGEGALLKNIRGERFMPAYHPLCELAPRDVVSRAIFQELQKTGVEHVYLDITFREREYLQDRFPNIYKTCLAYGIDMSKDMIPVAPAEHYCMGGIRTDIHGRTNIEGFFACGECACNGIHGANRLASNSLLEGLVFGRLIALQIENILEKQGRTFDTEEFRVQSPQSFSRGQKPVAFDKEKVLADIKNEMNDNVGIIRNREGLTKTLHKLRYLGYMLDTAKCETPADFELQNILLLSELVTESALEREESRGAHFRSDFSKTDDEKWNRHIIKRRNTQNDK